MVETMGIRNQNESHSIVRSLIPITTVEQQIMRDGATDRARPAAFGNRFARPAGE
jgi:hypothetical protein